jgi:transposase InsO family protein
MKIMAAKELITGKDIPGTGKLSFCEACAEGKAHRAPVKPVGEIKSTRMLELVHSDVARPMKTESFGDAKYVVTFVDDYSRCVTVYQMNYKSEVLEKFKEWEAAETNQAECKIKTLRTDNGSEYISTEFQDFLKEKGIRHETTVPYSPWQNGVPERMNRTHQEACSSLYDSTCWTVQSFLGRSSLQCGLCKKPSHHDCDRGNPLRKMIWK